MKKNTKKFESNENLNNTDLTFQNYKQVKYTGASNLNQKLVSYNKLSNLDNDLRRSVDNSISTDYDEHRSSTSSTESSTSSRLIDYSSTPKENGVHAHTKIKYTNQDLDMNYKNKSNNLSIKNLNTSDENSSPNENQKLNLQQRIQQKRHSLSIK